MTSRAARSLLHALWLALSLASVAAVALADQHVLVVAGLGGEAKYDARFAREAEQIAQAARAATGDPSRVTLLSGAGATSVAVTAQLERLRSVLGPNDALALVLIGHGSFDGEQYKLNLPGPDLGTKVLAQRLDAIRARQLIVNASSASGALLEPLERERRTLITATRSGTELMAPRFSTYFAESLSTPAADLDKNGWITAREAFDYTSRRVADHFKKDVSLATEHPQLQGSGGADLRLARLGGPAVTSRDPSQAGRMSRRDALELEIEQLRARKAELDPKAYQLELEKRLLELATLEDEIEKPAQGGATPSGDNPPVGRDGSKDP